MSFLFCEKEGDHLAAKRNPKADEAYKLYKEGMKLVDIAAKLEVPDGTVRRWKSTHGWDGERSAKSKNKKSERSDSVSWIEIEHKYVTDIRKKPCTLEELAQSYGVSVGSIEKYSMDHNWSDKRRKYKEKIKQKALEKSADADAERIARLLAIADKAADKTEQAIEELEQYIVRNKKKVKRVKYNDEIAIGKPDKEVIEETEHINIETGPVDRLGLSQVTGALKNLKDIYMIPNALDMQKHSQDVDKKRLELEYLRLDAQIKADEVADEDPEDNFLEALNAAATEVWGDEDGLE